MPLNVSGDVLHCSCPQTALTSLLYQRRVPVGRHAPVRCAPRWASGQTGHSSWQARAQSRQCHCPGQCLPALLPRPPAGSVPSQNGASSCSMWWCSVWLGVPGWRLQQVASVRGAFPADGSTSKTQKYQLPVTRAAAVTLTADPELEPPVFRPGAAALSGVP